MSHGLGTAGHKERGWGCAVTPAPCPMPLQPKQAAGGQQSSQHQALGCGGAHSRDAAAPCPSHTAI